MKKDVVNVKKINEEDAEESEKALVMQVKDFLTLDDERNCCEDCGKHCLTRDKSRKCKENTHVKIHYDHCRKSAKLKKND